MAFARALGWHVLCQSLCVVYCVVAMYEPSRQNTGRVGVVLHSATLLFRLAVHRWEVNLQFCRDPARLQFCRDPARLRLSARERCGTPQDVARATFISVLLACCITPTTAVWLQEQEEPSQERLLRPEQMIIVLFPRIVSSLVLQPMLRNGCRALFLAGIIFRPNDGYQTADFLITGLITGDFLCYLVGIISDQIVLAQQQAQRAREDELQARLNEEQTRVEHLEVRAMRLDYELAFMQRVERVRPPPTATASVPTGTASPAYSTAASFKSEPIGVRRREDKGRARVDNNAFRDLRIQSWQRRLNTAVAAASETLRARRVEPWASMMAPAQGLPATATPAVGDLPLGDFETYPATPPEWATSDED